MLQSRLAIAAILLAAAASPAAAGVWTATWAASPEATWGAKLPLPTRIPATLADATVRQVARIALGGDGLRIEISNRYGPEPLQIGSAHVAAAFGGGAIDPKTDHAVRFGGSAKVSVPPGQAVVSDPVDLSVADLAKVAVSLYLPKETPLATFHWDGKETAYVARGDHGAAEKISPESTLEARLFLTAIHVERPQSTAVVAAFGDSITDGDGVSVDGDRRWPDILAERLAPQGVSVINAGISGARLLKPGMGEAGLDRFDRDVLAQPGIRSVIVMMGTNDLAWGETPFDPHSAPFLPAAIEDGYRKLVARAHARGVRIVGATITPFEGAFAGTPIANFWNPAKNRVRLAVNEWIRTSGTFDAVLDFDAVARDPNDVSKLRADVDSGDHLHPGDAGNAVVAEGIDLGAVLGAR
ncbi:SGNH/GDSL hydrolase family protein [Alsobacter sp. KACC 23698]|uniref:SGNH/GDSL hydrolase family protein n=1 Tax=Alsobacter sp. KACC 23698 TaxID=3149229 RepID=A0AAU7JDD8_9HYPH